MITHPLYLDHVIERINELQYFETRLEQALMKELSDISEPEQHAIWLEYLRLGLDEEE
jgi:hypothetical protein